jgi:hypothetical protein
VWKKSSSGEKYMWKKSRLNPAVELMMDIDIE